jgi:hypothetical protein
MALEGAQKAATRYLPQLQGMVGTTLKGIAYVIALKHAQTDVRCHLPQPQGKVGITR